jgi:hypothetical protein
VKTQYFCLWCGRSFEPRTTGGKPQKFCGAPHQAAFFGAARAWALKLIETGLITPETLKAVVANVQVVRAPVQPGPAPADASPGASG